MITTDDPLWSPGLTGVAGFTVLLGIVPLVFVLRRNTLAPTPGS